MSRILLVSNRLPVTVQRSAEGLEVTRSSGGLATGLAGIHADSGGAWIGWPGHSEALSAEEELALTTRFAELCVVPVALSLDEVERYYEAFCNGVLWPLFHYLINLLPLEVHGFPLYEAINRRFAEAVVAAYQPGDRIWVHDYQLMLVPALVRERLPDATIGFFLHIPFPASDVFRVLPFRDQLLQGLLGADLIGFHTAGYMRHFASSVLRILGIATEVDHLRWHHRTVRLGVFPMGVDTHSYAALAESSALQEEVAALHSPGAMQLMLGIDRLDYTKGIPRRLLAFERLLHEHPELHGRVRLIQVAVPSRTKVGAYQEYREQVDGLIGRIHGALATPSWVPVHYLFRNLPQAEIAALYRAADVLLVTPLRDGMNLVAKEFIATRIDEDGVLVMSEFAGAASELAEALSVNPYDISGSAAVYHRALTMPAEERRTRMRVLRQRVRAYDVHGWARSFLEQLERDAQHRPRAEVSPARVVEDALRRMQAAEQLTLLLDYDGTLMPIVTTPDLARPDDELLALLQALAARPRTDVHVVSGRARETLQRWLGALPITLHAEHGLWSQRLGEAGKTNITIPAMPWREPVMRILRDYAERTPGALIEEKPAGLAWHYRTADPEFGPMQANELRLHLNELLSNTPVEILAGNKVIEIRLHGVNKGCVVRELLSRDPGSLFVGLGDDTTDEDLFAALPAGAIAIHIGDGQSCADVRLSGVAEARSLLRGLLSAPLLRR